MNDKIKRYRFFPYIIMLALPFFLCINVAYGQVQGTAVRHIRVGYLQSHFTAYGSERAWTGGQNAYYAGLIWPANYSFQDNAVIKRFWLACDDFTDSDARSWEKYGVYFAAGYVDESLFPMEMKQTAKFEAPTVIVDGINISAPYRRDVDEIDENQVPDRIVTNIVNTSMGLTMKRQIYAFSQQYHSDYFIKKFTFINSGNTDYDDERELTADLEGVYVSAGTRYSVCREGSFKIGDGQSWGKHTWVTRRGETYAQHAGQTLTESTPISNLDWLRCGFSWAGQSETNSFDNIGGPDMQGGGRLTAPQHAGTIILHVDQETANREDDPEQPAVLGWHAGDTYPSLGDMVLDKPMIELYDMVSGTPYKGKGGTDRFDETHLSSITDRIDPWTIHNDGGGTNVWISYGPFDIPYQDSIIIWEAEGIHGLDRQMCEKIGQRWKKAYENPNDNGPFKLPNDEETSNKDEYKNAWVYTGKDSIMLIFSRAKRNFDSNFMIPQPPFPPTVFEVESGGDRIRLRWQPSPSEEEDNFGGYRIYRAVGKPDTTYEMIFECGKETENPVIVHSFDDRSPVRGFSYYYYLVAFSDGSKNTDGITNPTGRLESGRFYTQTNEPAFLRRKAGTDLDAIRIVPNPYNIKARNFNYPGEQDKITFLNIPAFCTIKIYTERGDLIKTLEHNDGSGDESWNSTTSSRQVIVSGVYIAHFEVTKDYYDTQNGNLLYKKGDSKVKKFVVIR